MSLLNKLFGNPDRFFSLLDSSAQVAKASIDAVIKIITHNSDLPTLDEFVAARRKEKVIAEEINEELVRAKPTQIEREDVESLSRVLYRIPKTAEKFAERFILGFNTAKNVDFSRHASLLQKSAETIVEMTASLRGQQNLAKMRELNDRLHYFEGEADKLILDHYHELYSGKIDFVSAFILKDLYELLENCADCCRDAGNVVYHTVLKNSS